MVLRLSDEVYVSLRSGVPRLRWEDVSLNPGGFAGLFALGCVEDAGCEPTPNAAAGEQKRRRATSRIEDTRLISLIT
ncbi:hypothetical protein ZOD2009_00855 [Haladaptatus paucihalophilus DX253]|uniref:Uncharacterized protein n=1 Tax=Haladaptatus paucihalophilus DX253 TaxID=797209 RepID=E7QNZ5_HALPU|nr:hypothetical protein [Haladaptatus paucihalophilus]EFW93648.1 hypothetical protein ZOD2009_00855 [Haladaptatus paucihalophilus DX253]